MGTVIRPAISKKSTYWISRERYYELKHFCLQYPEWKKTTLELEGHLYRSPSYDREVRVTDISDPTYAYVEALDFFRRRMEMVEKCCRDAGKDLEPYLLKAVTEGLSFENLSGVEHIPCCRDVYYDIYRKFFWMLSQMRE